MTRLGPLDSEFRVYSPCGDSHKYKHIEDLGICGIGFRIADCEFEHNFTHESHLSIRYPHTKDDTGIVTLAP